MFPKNKGFAGKNKWDADLRRKTLIFALVSANQRFSASKLNSGVVMF
jgi:hypothetical protein